MNKIKKLLNLFYTFLKLGFVSFGGGLAIYKLYDEELVKKQKLITDDQLIDFYAISQTIPGIVIVNLALFIGNHILGFLGMIATMLGVTTPCIFIIVLIAKFLKSYAEVTIVQNIILGINIAVCAIIFTMTYEMLKTRVHNLADLLLVFIAFALVWIFNIPIYLIIICSILYSLIRIKFCKIINEEDKEKNKDDLLKNELPTKEGDNFD